MSAIWEGIAAATAGGAGGVADGRGARVVAYDRRGWGRSETPEDYRRTTVSEQAEDAVGMLAAHEIDQAVLCGAGLGAVVALDLLLRQPDLATAAVLIEPPLLAFLPHATEALSADRAAITESVREGGVAAALDLYLRGGLPALGAGAGRIPPQLAAVAREHPLSLFAELAAVAEWEIRTAALIEVTAPTRIVISASTPPLLRAAVDELAARLGGSELVRLGGEGLPHVSAAPELAGRIERMLHG